MLILSVRNLFIKLLSSFNYQYIEIPTIIEENIIEDTLENKLVFYIEKNSLNSENNTLKQSNISISKRKILRPEFTSFFRNQKCFLHEKYFYIGKVFRKERRQSLRLNEFEQFGVEIFNYQGIIPIIESVRLLLIFLSNFFKDICITINYIGEKENIIKYKEYINTTHNKTLEDVDKKRFIPEKGIWDFISEEGKSILGEFSLYLSEFVKVKHDPLLIRGLSYYRGFVFEIHKNDIAICGGGEYTTKYKLAGFGYSIGFERLIALSNKHQEKIAEELLIILLEFRKDIYDFYIKVSQLLSSNKINHHIAHKNNALKNIYKAKKNDSPYIMIGEKEATSNSVKVCLKNLSISTNLQDLVFLLNNYNEKDFTRN